MTTSSNSSTGIDKQALYGDYRDHVKQQNRLYMKAAYKSLDIADDDMGDITTDNSQHGIGTLGAVAIAAASGGLPLMGLAGLWTAGVFDRPASAPALPSPPAVVAPAEPEKTNQPAPELKTNTITQDWRLGEPIVE